MTLHRTPVHHDALKAVRDRRVAWHEAVTGLKDGAPRASSGFRYASGGRMPLSVLVVLCELRAHNLIVVDGGVVLLTQAGSVRLAERDGKKAEESVMGRNFYVVVKVPILNMDAEDVDELQADPLAFIADADLWDEGTVESIVEMTS